MLAVGEGRTPPRALSATGTSCTITPDATGTCPRAAGGVGSLSEASGAGVSGCQGPGGVGLGDGVAGPVSLGGIDVVSSASTRVASRAPADTLSPTLTRTCSTRPAWGEGTSIEALSLSKTATGSSRLMDAPGETRTSMTATS